ARAGKAERDGRRNRDWTGGAHRHLDRALVHRRRLVRNRLLVLGEGITGDGNIRPSSRYHDGEADQQHPLGRRYKGPGSSARRRNRHVANVGSEPWKTLGKMLSPW